MGVWETTRPQSQQAEKGRQGSLVPCLLVFVSSKPRSILIQVAGFGLNGGAPGRAGQGKQTSVRFAGRMKQAAPCWRLL